MSKEIENKSPERFEWTEKIRGACSKALNIVHKEEYSERFWAILLEGYVDAAITRKSDLDHTIVNRRQDRFPVSTRYLLDRKQKTTFNLKQIAKYFLSRKNKKEIYALLEKEEHFRIGFPEYEALDLDQEWEKLPEFNMHSMGLGGRSKREALKKISKRVTPVYLQNCIRQLPDIFVEIFESIYNEIPLFEPEKKVFHVHNIRSDFDRFLIAKYVEHGAGLIWYQHGSHYGEFQWEYMHHIEHHIADEFRTWGWTLKEKDRPWKAYRLEKFKREVIKYNASKKYDLMICFPKMYEIYSDEAEYDTEQLLKGLNRDKYKTILARPRPLHRKHSHEAEVGFISDERVKKSSGLAPIEKEVAASRLVVQLRVPATNFLECIYVNQPTVGLLKNDQPTKLVMPHYDALIRLGVLHKNAESLIGHLNNIEPDEWWHRVIQSDEYSGFRKTFAAKMQEAEVTQ